MDLKILLYKYTNYGVDEYLDEIIGGVEKVFSAAGLRVEVTVWPEVVKPPIKCFDWPRAQYNASCLTSHLRDFARLSGVSEDYYLAGIGYLDAYEPGLNFVFGLASITDKACSVFTKRLKPTLDKGVANNDLYVERVVKEVVHELGHLAGLKHCSNRECVMSFSNSVSDVDAKKRFFCEKCSRLLRS